MQTKTIPFAGWQWAGRQREREIYFFGSKIIKVFIFDFTIVVVGDWNWPW